MAVVPALALMATARPSAAFTITPTFTSGFNTAFGANAAAAQAAWIAAANVFTTNFTDPIHVNITVDGVAGTGVFGQSNTFLLSPTYANLRLAAIADAKSADDATATGAGGSIAAVDPVGGTHTWWVTKAQAKALGLLADDLTNDGTTTFGAGNPFTFSGPIAAGTYDFQGVAAHEISEVLGRLGIMGATIGNFANSYDLADLFTFSGAGARVLTCPSNNNFFSIDAGTTLLKKKNDYCVNHLDTEDWAPGTNDAFNQFSNSGVVNAVSAVDLRQMDVLGYDRAPITTPEPSTLILLASGFAGMGATGFRNRMRRN